MSDTVSFLAGVLFGVVAAGLFAHIIALIALSPILYFVWSPDPPARRWAALLLGAPALWALMIYAPDAGYVRQYSQGWGPVGILAGAFVSTSFICFGMNRKWFEDRKWPWLTTLLGAPLLGYAVATLMSR